MGLKSELTEHYQEHEADYGKEETKNVIDILSEYDEELSNLKKWDKVLLLRLVNNDDELYNKLDEIEIPEEDEDEDEFA
jgi:tRNA (Thr-GGU) A37 N-methylase